MYADIFFLPTPFNLENDGRATDDNQALVVVSSAADWLLVAVNQHQYGRSSIEQEKERTKNRRQGWASIADR